MGKYALPVHDEITKCTCHRPPTRHELISGEGATHYRDFPIAVCCHKGTRFKKRWFVADDGLRYYR